MLALLLFPLVGVTVVHDKFVPPPTPPTPPPSVAAPSGAKSLPVPTPAAPAPAVPAEPLSAEDADQKELQDLIDSKKKMGDQYNSLNQFNPLSNTKMGSAEAQALPPQLKFLQTLMSNKAFMDRVMKMSSLMTQEGLQADAKTLVGNPDLKFMYGGFGVVFVLYFLLKRRVMAATDRLWLRMLLRLGMAGIFFLSLFLVAYGFLGQPLVRVILALKSVML